MTLVNRKQISLYEEAEAGLNSLVKQTAQVGVGLLGMLLLTGGNPPALTVGLSVVGGIAFVAWSEEKRLTKFYARRSPLKNNSWPVPEIFIPSFASCQLSYSNSSEFPNSSESESLSNDIKQILELDTNNLSELVKQAGLNPYEDLAGANLSEATGVGCKLSRFNLSRADLDNADLSRADLSFANLSNAKLKNVKLCRADLSGADLRNALLMDADLSFADLSDADLSDADLSNADLSNADLSNANLHNANLTATNLIAAKVENARFGKNAGLDEKAKYELQQRGAIFPQYEGQKAAIGSIYDNMDKLGTVAETIHPGQRGRVSFQATTWFAVCPYDIVLMPDTRVRVIEHHDSTLIVEPIDANPAQSQMIEHHDSTLIVEPIDANPAQSQKREKTRFLGF